MNMSRSVTKSTILRITCTLLAFAVVLPLLSIANGQSVEDYPSRSITFVVPWAPGGSSDTAARIMADIMEQELDWPVRVENRPGAGSAVGLLSVANARPDGYTFGLATSSLITNAILGNAAVDYTMFEPVRLTHTTPGAFAVHESAPWDSLEDLIAEARENPDAVRVGNNGTGSNWHLLSLMLQDSSGVQFTDVPYGGGSELVAAVLGQHIEGAMQSVIGWMPNVEAGRLKLLGVASAERLDQIPDTPTFIEQGYDIEYGLMVGFLLPEGTPQPVVDKLSGALGQVAEHPRFQEFAANNGMIVTNLDSDQFADFLDREAQLVETLADRYFSD